MKKCRECGNILPIENFYKHKNMLDGHLNKCKDCVKKRILNYRYNNIEKIREYDRNRGKTEKRYKKSKITTRNKRKEITGYAKAHRDVGRAIKSGKLKKLAFCVRCGLIGKTEGHHDNYRQALSVIWLCPICHKKYHNSTNNEHIKIIEMIINYKNGIYC